MKYHNEHDKYLRFEFEFSGLNNFSWGICRENNSVVNEAVIWNEISGVMNKEWGAGKRSDWYPWWNYVDKNQEFDAGFRHWDKSEMPWVSMKDGTLAEKITDLAVRVYSAFSDANQLHLLHRGNVVMSATHTNQFTPTP